MQLHLEGGEWLEREYLPQEVHVHRSGGGLVQRAMRPVAEWGILGVLAETPRHVFLFFNHHLDGCPFATLMTAITEGLVGRETTGTPPIGPGLHFLNTRLGVANFRWLHAGSLAPRAESLKWEPCLLGDDQLCFRGG